MFSCWLFTEMKLQSPNGLSPSGRQPFLKKPRRRSEDRRSAAGRQAVIERRERNRVQTRQDEEQCTDEENQRQRGVGGTHLPLRQQRDDAMMRRRGGIRMNRLMQRAGDGESLKEQKEQQADRRAGAGKT